MVAGHGGKSGRYDSWRQAAWEWAFLAGQVGALDRVDA
jgi:oligopeptidase B